MMKLKNTTFPYLIMFLFISTSVVALSFLDKDLTHWTDSLEIGNIINGFIFYIMPAIIIVLYFYKKLKSIYLNTLISILLSLIMGIPIAFISVIFILKMSALLVHQ